MSARMGPLFENYAQLKNVKPSTSICFSTCNEDGDQRISAAHTPMFLGLKNNDTINCVLVDRVLYDEEAPINDPMMQSAAAPMMLVAVGGEEEEDKNTADVTLAKKARLLAIPGDQPPRLSLVSHSPGTPYLPLRRLRNSKWVLGLGDGQPLSVVGCPILCCRWPAGAVPRQCGSQREVGRISLTPSKSAVSLAIVF
jgi:hypothetical protein